MYTPIARKTETRVEPLPYGQTICSSVDNLKVIAYSSQLSNAFREGATVYLTAFVDALVSCKVTWDCDFML
jgi:hypothetical protein